MRMRMAMAIRAAAVRPPRLPARRLERRVNVRERLDEAHRALEQRRSARRRVALRVARRGRGLVERGAAWRLPSSCEASDPDAPRHY